MLLRGLDQAREVSWLPALHPARPSGQSGEFTDVPPQEYEHLAASLDGARTPLAEKMQTFAPASSKVGLVEEAEAHARRLDQLAQNLSRCSWGPGVGGRRVARPSCQTAP